MIGKKKKKRFSSAGNVHDRGQGIEPGPPEYKSGQHINRATDQLKGHHAEATSASRTSCTPRRLLLLLGPITVLAGLTVAIGLQPQLLFTVAERAATQLLDSSAYTQAVLGVSQAPLQPIDILQGAMP